jgi:hypothetical protein
VARLLLIEDDPAIRTPLVRALRERGHAVAAAHTAMTGLQTALDERPDLVVLDLGLPDLDGLELLRMLRGVSRLMKEAKGDGSRRNGPEGGSRVPGTRPLRWPSDPFARAVEAPRTRPRRAGQCRGARLSVVPCRWWALACRGFRSMSLPAPGGGDQHRSHDASHDKDVTQPPPEPDRGHR